MTVNADLNKDYNMHLQGVAAFPHYYVGINSLAELATQDDKICVFNILGGESRTVTPISNVYSSGNIICGTMPGRSGDVMKTAVGDIPVYNNIKEALDAGHQFNVAVIYVPPAGVKDSVLEAVRVNPKINKVVILTEKVSIRDSRIIRHYCQQKGVDVFGGNCLGIADAHNKVRIGGALGGSAPEESLVPGTIALYSNSGNFTTTIATYMLTEGWGTTVSLSSGKDVYIHYAAAEFTHALHNDDRSKAAVMYIEPGGYYEKDIVFKKPVVTCIVGRWKSKLTRSCGHAGAIAGSGDNAMAKEEWFKEKFDVADIYTPANPVFSKKGAVVTNISHIPEALTKVMEANGIQPDFNPIGDLALKCWFSNDQGIELPAEFNTPIVEALEPYNEQITAMSKQMGAIFPRENLKDASGTAMMDPKTQVSKMHGVTVLDASTRSFEENLVHSLVRSYPTESGRAMANIALNAYVNRYDTVGLTAAQASRNAGNSPNTALSAAVAIVGPDNALSGRVALQCMAELFRDADLDDPENADFDVMPVIEKALQCENGNALLSQGNMVRGTIMLNAVKARGIQSVFIRFLEALAEKTGVQIRGQVVIAAISAHIAWQSLRRKKISLTTFTGLPWHFRVFSCIVGASLDASKQTEDTFCGISNQTLVSSWSFTQTAYLALMEHEPNEEELFSLTVLLGLIITNGPGTISAQGTKGAVSSDGPEVPDRVQLNKCYIGFLTHTGYAHGGNGFEAMKFLMDRFGNVGLKDPGDANHGINLKEMAREYAREYLNYKKKAKAEGNLSYAKIPCVNHPVFKDKEVNYDPREVFVNDLFKKRGSYNIFHEFYHELVQALFDTGVSRNIYCVNVDAVIAVILLKLMWKPYADGEISENALESSAFTTFLFGRMIGSAAEMDDHVNRGRNMDTRTAASKCRFTG